jgi:enoyl-CoA hydratase/carnithine racemase
MTMAESQLVLRHDAEGLCTLTLNRPDKRNALNTELFAELDLHLADLEGRAESIGCVLLRGAGKSFCAGADLKAIGGPGPSPPPVYKTRIIERLGRLPQPVIAAIQGDCFTGGLELALAADFIVAEPTARFADTHGKWSLVGGWGMSQRLPRRIGMARAKRMMMTAEIVMAAEAASIGLIDKIAGDEGLEGAVAELANSILANSWYTNRETKRLLIATEGMSLREGLAHEHYYHPGVGPDARARIDAFKRPP